MAKTPSNMVTLGTKAPKFELHNTVDDILYSSEQLFSKNGTVVMFICNHCPFVIHVIDEIVSISENYKENISFVAISSNDVINYPDDSPELMKKFAVNKNFSFPYLFDETQEVAKAYSAVCTPDIFLYNKDKKLEYRGRLDDNWQQPHNVTREELRMAIDAVLNGNEIDFKQVPSMGCNIKWK